MSKTILAVDDSVSVRKVVKLILVAAGYTVVQAVDGAIGWITKPFQQEQLLSVVRKVLGA